MSTTMIETPDSKRLCESSLASPPTPNNPDPYGLRTVGSRVRKSVTEGYKNRPSSFAKAQSTGSIFRSMNDTLRDVYSNSSTPVDNATTRKRSRSLSPLIPPDADMLSDDDAILLVEAIKPSRPMKPLRRSRHSLLETRSLPNGPLLFGNPDHTPAIKTIDEEVDWSNQKADGDFEQTFEPMVL